MKIDIPFEIGDPVIKLEFNQHDGYYIEYKGFDYTDIVEIDKTIFTTYTEAKKKERELNAKRYGA